jgi:predicted protein tyrosine phosphatase
MHINFVSRAQAISLIQQRDPFQSHNLISINDTIQHRDIMQSWWQEHAVPGAQAFFCVFQDIDDPTGGFTPELASDIVSFVESTSEHRRELLVHCLMGVSRSAAVAKWANHHVDQGADRRLTAYNLDNRYVYSGLLEAAFNVSDRC